MLADRLFLPPQPLARGAQPLGIAGQQRQVADGPERLVEQLLVGAILGSRRARSRVRTWLSSACSSAELRSSSSRCTSSSVFGSFMRRTRRAASRSGLTSRVRAGPSLVSCSSSFEQVGLRRVELVDLQPQIEIAARNQPQLVAEVAHGDGPIGRHRAERRQHDQEADEDLGGDRETHCFLSV